MDSTERNIRISEAKNVLDPSSEKYFMNRLIFMTEELEEMKNSIEEEN